MGPDDPSGFERFRHVEGVWRLLGIIGLLLMLGGLGVFGYGLLSTFMSDERVPRMPTIIPIGFGIAIAGGIAYSLALAFGVPRKKDFRHKVHVGPEFNVGGNFSVGGDLDASVRIRIENRTKIVNRIDHSLNGLTLPPDVWPVAEAAMQDVRDAVENDDPEPAIARHLEKLTRILSAAGALVGGGTGIVQAIKVLARELGSAGGGVLSWLP